MSSPALATEAIDPDVLSALSEGVMSVRQAMVFTGDSRTRLYQLMDAGVLDWFKSDRDRRITRRSLVAYLAAAYAAHKQTTGAGART